MNYLRWMKIFQLRISLINQYILIIIMVVKLAIVLSTFAAPLK